MFKRITKKQQKREQDEELGLDEDAKQMFGLQDTDSDESSSSNSHSDSDDGLDRAGPAAEMKTEWLAADGTDSEDEVDSDEEGLDLDDDGPPLSLEEAVKDPIYSVSIDNDDRACIACPKKLLKSNKMVEVHTASAAHVRRFEKFRNLAESTKDRSKDPRRIAAAVSQTPKVITNAEGISKRGLKRKRKLEVIKRKREKTKQIVQRKKRERAKKEAREGVDEIGGKDDDSRKAAGSSQSGQLTSERPAKRRKISNREAAHENDGHHGGDNRDPGVAGEEALVAVKPPRMKTKVKGKSKYEGKATTKNGEPEASGVGAAPKLKGKVKASKDTVQDPVVRFFEDDGITIKDKSPDGAHQSTKKRDLLNSRTKGHMIRVGAGKSAKLSDTRTRKDKSKRAPRTGSERKESAARKSFASKKTSRYFDGAEDGTVPKEPGPKKFPAKKANPEERNLTGDSAKRRGESNWKKKPADDLVIFD